MKAIRFLVFALLVAETSAFGPKKRESATSRPAFMDTNKQRREEATAATAAAAATASVPYCADETCNSPPFTTGMFVATSYVEAALAAQNENDWDDDTVVGYGTGIVACFVSLALGFSLGYVTL
mmetsp:Transcript_18351/g.42496  ORF Transcript_18351/g.42496 Transcript_18351/m.42496 type:complete len:124 (+) Transcript_18351:111-482(+)|eukprot:CAMPEP_0116846066 /NCGR_PEP_ID=MMETSP0418-20121206/13629_1 /TAXON_ID=1158023 /ORGANISM="Astrosyne radiata, Strain 13vi08-1A" /LENGTH=123 /DNA_ID=CAMNT_0004477273 /DNA_START=189 /DNA_END=560 /DNA_ORIENTATION=+